MNSAEGCTHQISDIASLTQIGIDLKSISPLGRGGASAKRFYRLAGDHKCLGMITDPETVNSTQRASDLTNAWGLRTPAVIQAYPGKGIILFEDVGDLHLRDLEPNAEEYKIAYGHCLELLLRSARMECSLGDIRASDEFYDDWIASYLEKFHQKFVDNSESIEKIWQLCQAQKRKLGTPKCLSLGDVSPDNIMIDGEIDDPSSYVFIDIQDAMRAPFGADIISLLQDVRSCAVPFQWGSWLSSHFSASERDDALGEMSVMGLFRLLRIAGTFADLDERHKFTHYLSFLPYVRMHLDETLSALKASELREWLALEKWLG